MAAQRGRRHSLLCPWQPPDNTARARACHHLVFCVMVHVMVRVMASRSGAASACSRPAGVDALHARAVMPAPPIASLHAVRSCAATKPPLTWPAARPQSSTCWMAWRSAGWGEHPGVGGWVGGGVGGGGAAFPQTRLTYCMLIVGASGTSTTRKPLLCTPVDAGRGSHLAAEPCFCAGRPIGSCRTSHAWRARVCLHRGTRVAAVAPACLPSAVGLPPIRSAPISKPYYPRRRDPSDPPFNESEGGDLRPGRIMWDAARAVVGCALFVWRFEACRLQRARPGHVHATALRPAMGVCQPLCGSRRSAPNGTSPQHAS